MPRDAALAGVWQATDLAFLKAAGWTNMTLTFAADGTFTMVGDNPYGPDGKLDIRGVATLAADTATREIDFTVGDSNSQAFFKNGEGMPGLFALSPDDNELTLAWGSTQFAIGRPESLAGGAVFRRAG